MTEKRRFIRLNTNVMVRWKKVAAAAVSAFAEDVTKNISAGGICLLLYEDKVVVGDVLALEIDLPTGKVVATKGRVVWVKEFEILGRDTEKKQEAGIEFLDITDADRADLSRFVFSFIQTK